MSRSAVAACLLLVVAQPLAGQDDADRLSAFGRLGALVPRSALASPDQSLVEGRRTLLLERAGWVGIGVEYDPAATLPLISASLERSIGGELAVRSREEDRHLGPASLTAVLIEAGFRRELADHLTARAILGAGALRYGFPAVAEPDLARMLEEEKLSLAGVVGVALTVRIDRFAIALSARDMISTFDSPGITVGGYYGDHGSTGDVDERQHDLLFTLRVGYRARGGAAATAPAAGPPTTL